MTKDDIPTPLLIALVALLTGAFLSMAVFTVAVLAAWPRPWVWGLASFFLIAAPAWVGFMAWWQRLLERIHGINDQPPMQANPNETVLHLRVDWDEGRAGLFDDLGVSDRIFIEWACAVASGKSLGENHWTGRYNPFSKGQYHNFLDRLEFHGVVRQKSKAYNSGYELTGKGRALANECLRRYGHKQNYLPNEIRYLPGS